MSEKIKKSLAVIKETARKFDPNKVFVAWTGGKDSTVVLHLIRRHFGGKIPFRVFFNDSTLEFPEIYKFIDDLEREWEIDLIRAKHAREDLAKFDKIKSFDEKKDFARIMKINSINKALEDYKIEAFITGVRWDEDESRAQEKYQSPRESHVRINPILHFTEADIWDYIKNEQVPYVPLYDKGYRCLGEKPFTRPVPKDGAERDGRFFKKGASLGKLRNLGHW